MSNASWNFRCDAWRHTGASHEVCEDYCVARAGSCAGHATHTHAHAIVADGCSTAPDTDLGAAVLARSLQSALGFLAAEEPAPRWRSVVWNEARHAGAAIALPDMALTATLVAAIAAADECRTLMWGDGVIAARRRDSGEWLLTRHVYENEAPYYLRYEADGPVLNALANGTRVTRQRVCVRSNGSVKFLPDRPLTLHAALEAASWSWREHDIVAVMSDGVGTVRNGDAALEWHEAAHALLAFRNLHGEFVARRARRTWKDWSKRGFAPADDLSIAAVYAE